MPFDPEQYNKVKKSLEPASSGGFDPVAYERAKAQVTTPRPAPVRPGPVGRTLDFARRAFMGDAEEPQGRNTFQNLVRDAEEMVTGLSHLIGQGAVEGGKLVKDVATSAVPTALSTVLGPPSPQKVMSLADTPLGERIRAFPGQVATITSPEGRQMAKESFIKPAAESVGKSFGYKEGKELIKKPSFENLKNFVKAPIKQFSEHPLFTIMDWSLLADIAGTGLRGAAKVGSAGLKAAGATEAAAKVADITSTVRPGLPYAPRGEIMREFSTNPIVKYGIQKPFDKVMSNQALQEFISSSPVMKYLAPAEALTPEARAGRVAEKVAKKAQDEFYRNRNARMQEVMDQFNKLTDVEKRDFIPIVQGRAMPRSMSPQFKEVYDWYKKTVADEQSRFQLADETVKRVAYQPLAVARGLLSPEDYKLALRGDEAAIARVRTVTDDLAESRVRVQEQAIKEWLGSNIENFPNRMTSNVHTSPAAGAQTGRPLKVAAWRLSSPRAGVAGHKMGQFFFDESVTPLTNDVINDVMANLSQTAYPHRASPMRVTLDIKKPLVFQTYEDLMDSRYFPEDVELMTAYGMGEARPYIEKAARRRGYDAIIIQEGDTYPGPVLAAKGINRPGDPEIWLLGDINKQSSMREFPSKGRASAINKLARELAEETAPDPIYFPSVFQQKIKLADFMPSRFLQKFRPGFLKGRTGVFGFIEKDPAAAFAVHKSQMERFLQNETLINAIKDKFALPLKKASDLKDGWKTFAPDGYIGFYRGSMPLQEAFLKGVGMGQNIDDAFTSAIQKLMPAMVEDKQFIGVRRPTLYQIPADVASKLQEVIMPSGKVPELFKLIYDKPLQAFKYSVLGLSPRWIVNNTVGNIITTMTGRVSPESFVKAGKSIFRDLIPEEVSSGGFRRAEFPGLEKVMGPQTGVADRITGFFSGKTPTEGVLRGVQNVVSGPIKATGKFSETVFEVNSNIEDLFRNATFIDKTTKAAIEKITKDTAGGIIDMKQSLNKFLQRGDFAESNVAKVAKQMLENEDFRMKMVDKVNAILNDYSHMSKFERNVVRRVVPFWSWWKFVNTLFWTMPVKDPAMAQAIKLLGQAGQEIAKDEWKANGLDVKEIPEWMRGNVILGLIPEDKMLEMLNTRSLNPLSSATEWPSIAPQIQLAIEQRTGKRFPFGTPFTHPDEMEFKGMQVKRVGKSEYERIEHPTPPPIMTHALRTLPQVQMLEALVYPYRRYSGESILSPNAVTRGGRPIKLSPGTKIANILGMPISETDYRQLRKAHQSVQQAGYMIERNLKRSGRATERIKLGKE